MSQEDARREARRAVDSSGLTRKQFAAQADVDIGTLSDFLSGDRWPQPRTLTKIEGQLGWPPGRITDLAEGVSDAAPPPPVPAVGALSTADDYTRQIIQLVRAHPGLHPVNKAHLAKQVEVLALVPVDAEIAPHEGTEEPPAETREDSDRRIKAEEEAKRIARLQAGRKSPTRH